MRCWLQEGPNCPATANDFSLYSVVSMQKQEMGFTSNRKEHFLKKDVFTLIKQWRSAGVFCVFHLFFNVNLALRLKKASYPHIPRHQHRDAERQQQHVPGRPQPCKVAQGYQDLHSQAAPHSIHHFQWLFFITLSEDSHLKLYVMCCVIRANYTVSP